MPALQFVQEVVPVVEEYIPMGQVKQLDDIVAPVIVIYVPDTQLVQAAEPVLT